MKERLYKFLNNIGIATHITYDSKSFLNLIRIKDGELLIHPKCTIAHILHEAGHLAILPGRFRKYANDDLSNVMNKMSNEIDFSNPDSQEARAFMQTGDCEATAWAWSAGKHLNISEKIIISNKNYDKTGADIRLALSANSYFGINGLSAAGFCSVRKFSNYRNLPIYPNLIKWIQE